MKYPIYTPDIQPYTTSIQKAISDGWISSQGEFLEKTRIELERHLGTPYVVLVNNGTSATHLLYKAIKFRYPSIRKLYVPDYVFVAVWNCALYEYSSDQLVVLPTDPVTLNPVFPETFEPDSALVVVHNLGNVVNVPQLKRTHPNLVVVEDCCEAFLEEYEGQKTGTAGLCAAVSFFGNKLMTTGEGGAWYTHDKELFDFVYKTCHHGTTSQRYVYDTLGYNYRMTNLQAALLYDQLCDSETILTKKRIVRDRYKKLLSDRIVTNGLWMNALRIPGISYSSLFPILLEYGIDTRPMFYSLHTHAHLRDIPVTSSEIRHNELLMIPSSPSLTCYDQVYISRVLLALARGLRPPVVTTSNARLLDAFLANDIPDTFRYFKTRTVETCLKNHTLTLLAMDGDAPVGYAHLDDRWIGLCVLPTYQGRGYGSFLLDLLLDTATLLGIPEVRLTVDKTNSRAYELYARRGFQVEEVKDTYFYMTKRNDSATGVHR